MKTLCFDCIDSTNTYCKNHYQQLEDRTFVQALMQSKGKGRNDRLWESEKGTNLLFSLLIKEKSLFEKTSAISIVAAYSISCVLQDYGLNPMIKWPNDVYIEDKKICGILLESICTDQMQCLVIGIGLNVNQKTFSTDCLHQPTSLTNELHCEVDLEELKQKVYEELLKNLQQLNQGKDFLEEIRILDYLKGKEAYALINDEKKKIEILGIDDDYALKVKENNNVLHLHSGEISFHI